MWSRVPLVRLIIPVITGIVITEYLLLPYFAFWLILTMGLIVIAGSVLYSLLFGFRLRWLYGLLILSFFFLYASRLTASYKVKEKHTCNLINDSIGIYVGVIDDVFQLRERSCKAKVRVVGRLSGDDITRMDAGVMVYTQPDSLLPLAKPNSYIIIRTGLKTVRPPANPGEFNYKEYLRKQGVYHTTYLKKGAWRLLKQSQSHNIRTIAAEMRRSLLAKLFDNGIADDHFGISSALLLGDDSQLDDHIRDKYARAGAMHILCVSGLHVGVIFLVLNTLLGFMRFMAGDRIILPLVLIGCIWMYALITGLAPPVMRASIMISFIIIGNAIQRQKNVYNTLAASAFLMLLAEPYVLLSAGFQLSYAAVLGIVFLQRPLYNMIYCKYSFPDKLWAITSVSIAAQIGTMPVVLYYFHQFPVYSLITNLFVIPLSSLIIYSGLLLFILPSITQLSLLVAWVLDFFIMLMNQGIQWVEKLPGALISNVSYDLPLLACTYFVIVSMSIYLIYRRKSLFIFSLCCILLSSSYRLYKNHLYLNKKEFVVYSVNGYSVYDHVSGKNHTLYCDSALLNDPATLAYSLAPHWLEHGLNDPDTIILPSTETKGKSYGRVYRLDVPDLKVVTWHGHFPRCHPPQKRLKVDLLILRGKFPDIVEEVLRWFDPQKVILDSSVPPWVKAPNDDHGFWSTRKQGAFVLPG